MKKNHKKVIVRKKVTGDPFHYHNTCVIILSSQMKNIIEIDNKPNIEANFHSIKLFKVR